MYAVEDPAGAEFELRVAEAGEVVLVRSRTGRARRATIERSMGLFCMHYSLPAISEPLSPTLAHLLRFSQAGSLVDLDPPHATETTRNRESVPGALPPRGPNSGRVEVRFPKISSAYPAASRCAWLVPGSLCLEWRPGAVPQ